MITQAQIGQCGVLLVQYKLLQYGIESSHLTTDAGIDLVAYSPRKRDAVTLQVKSKLRPGPAGGKGKLALAWSIRDNSPATMAALVDISTDRVWLFWMKEFCKIAQQHRPDNTYHLYFYTDPTAKPKRPGTMFWDFEKYLLENVVKQYF